MHDLAPRPPAEDRSPFKALLAAWSLVVVILAAGGFSSRWNYDYNFGLQNLVLQEPLTTLPVYAIEIIRNPENLADLLWLAVVLLVPFEILRVAAAWAAAAIRERWEDRLAWRGETPFGKVVVLLLMPQGGLVIDAMRAGIIVYIAFYVGGLAGTRDYWINVVERTSRLPKITAIMPAGQFDAKEAAVQLPFICDTGPLMGRQPSVDPPFIGDPGIVGFLSGGAGCSSAERSWRLLFRDDKFVYPFATIPAFGGRPDTLVLPNSDKLTLVMR